MGPYAPPLFYGGLESTVLVTGTTSVFVVYTSESPPTPSEPYVMHDMFAPGQSSTALPLPSSVAAPVVEYIYGSPIIVARGKAVSESGESAKVYISLDSGG